MATITTRSGKGSALTHTEMDNNLTNLNTDKIEAGSTDTLTNKTINTASNTITVVEADISDLQSYLTAETNDLTAAVTWANVPDANITQSSVTQHQAALTITESQISDLSHYTNSDVDAHLNQSNPTSGYVLSWNGTDYAWVEQSGGDVVDDTTPQLGGDLDVNGNSIVSVTNGDIAITPNGTGNTLVTNLTLANGFDTNNYEISDGVGTEVKFADNIRLRGTKYVFFEEGTSGNGIKLQAPTGVTGTPTFTLPAADGTTGQILKTDGSGNLSFTDDAGGIALTDISVGAEGTPSGDGSLAYDNSTGVFTYTPPVDITGNSATATALQTARNIAGQSFDGTANITIGINDLSDVDTTGILNDKILKYNSTSGNWEIADDSTGAGGLASLIDDTTPQLGGDLDVNGNSIVSTSNGNITLTPNGTGDVVLGTMTFDADQTIGAGQDNYVLTYDNATGKISLEAAAAGGLADVVDDTTPQLGGNLDVNGNSIVSASNGNIAITPDGTGVIQLGATEITSANTLTISTASADRNILEGTDSTRGNNLWIGPSSHYYAHIGNHYGAHIGGAIPSADMTVGRYYGPTISSELRYNNATATQGGTLGRDRATGINWARDLKGIASYGSDVMGRGMLGTLISGDIYNTDTTNTAKLVKYAGVEVWPYLDGGNAFNYDGSEIASDVEVDKWYGVNVALEYYSGFAGGSNQINTESAAFRVASVSINDSDSALASGAIAYGYKNDVPNSVEKFGSIKHYREKQYTATHSASGTLTVDYDNGQLQVITLSDNITSFTMSNWPGGTNDQIGSCTLILKQDGTGSRTVSFTAGASETFKFANGIKTAQTAANDYTVIHITQIGTDYLWTVAGGYTA